MGKSVVRRSAGRRRGVRLRVVRKTHPMKRRGRLQISRSRLAAELWRRHKTELRSVKPNRRSEDSEQGNNEDGLATPCRRDERQDRAKERNMSTGADVLGQWESLHTPLPVACALRELGFTTPTAIQREAIPPAIVEKCDIIGAAETGSGKTLAFAVPILHYILNHCRSVEGSEERRRRRRVRDMGGEGRRIVDLNVVIHGGTKKIEEEEEENDDEEEEEEEEEKEEEEEEGGQEEEELDTEDHSELEESGFELMEEQSGGEGEGDMGGGVGGGVGLLGYRDNISDEDFEKMLAGTLSPWGEVDQSHDYAGGSHDHGDITSISHDPTPDKHVGYNGKLIALVLTPTRELALQVHSHITAAVKYTSIKVCTVVGGMAVERQERLLRQQPPIVVGTPGRLWKLMQEGDSHLCCLDNLRFLVLDEADRMVEFGHYQEVGSIMDRINGAKEAGSRQNLVFSATLTLPRQSVEQKRRRRKRISGEESLDNLISSIGLRESMKVVDLTQAKGTVATLTETKITCTTQEKDIYLYYFLLTHPGRTLIFVNSISCLHHVRTLLEMLHLQPHPLHAHMQQKQRLKNLERFTSDPKGLLVASDVAARGLDIPHVQHVIHYQVPRNSELYVHRSGRTARAQLEGLSVLLVGPEDVHAYNNIRRTLNRDNELPTFPVDPSYLAPLRDRVRLARQIVSMEQSGKKVSRGNKWALQVAKAMEIEVEEDMLVQEPVVSRKEHEKLQKMKAELASLLKTPVLPHSLSKTYPTRDRNHRLLAGLQDLDKGRKIVVATETDALTVAKQSTRT